MPCLKIEIFLEEKWHCFGASLCSNFLAITRQPSKLLFPLGVPLPGPHLLFMFRLSKCPQRRKQLAISVYPLPVLEFAFIYSSYFLQLSNICKYPTTQIIYDEHFNYLIKVIHACFTNYTKERHPVGPCCVYSVICFHSS